MAFLVDATLKGYECRGVASGTSKKGNQFYSIRLESPDGRTCEVSCTDSGLFGAVQMMRKTSVYNLDCRMVSGRERSYISLLRAPVRVSDGDSIPYNDLD